MAYEEKDMTGVLFENTDKDKDTQPDWSGTILINGKKYRIAGWNAQGTKKRISIKASELR